MSAEPLSPSSTTCFTLHRDRTPYLRIFAPSIWLLIIGRLAAVTSWPAATDRSRVVAQSNRRPARRPPPRRARVLPLSSAWTLRPAHRGVWRSSLSSRRHAAQRLRRVSLGSARASHPANAGNQLGERLRPLTRAAPSMLEGGALTVTAYETASDASKIRSVFTLTQALMNIATRRRSRKVRQIILAMVLAR